MKVAVIGAGSWGTALARLINSGGHSVTLWGRDSDDVAQIAARRENLRYLPGFALPPELTVTSDAGCCCDNSDMAVVAVPSAAVAEVCRAFAPILPPSCLVLCASKGLDPDTGGRLTVTAANCTGIPFDRIAAMSGPNLAVELARGAPSAAVIASSSADTASRCRQVMSGPSFRVYTNDDVVGVELGGALKNIYAIAAGICEGMGYGDNTKAALLTRGLAEMTRLGAALGARHETFLGLAGVGDLIATAASRLSRNLRLGLALGQGMGLPEALEQIGQVAEGAPTTLAAVRVARERSVDMPIASELAAVLFERQPPAAALANLMNRAWKDELS